MSEQKKIHLNLFLDGFGHHLASWRHPITPLEKTAFERYLDATKTAERGLLDSVFLADSLAVEQHVIDTGLLRGNELEPLTTLSALATHTQHIGLIGTATTSYNEPYHIARKFASLDVISKGRAGWNMVTTDLATEAKNFNQDQHIVHHDRYQRAEEFYDVVDGLWHSWQPNALLRNKKTGQFFDATKLKTLNYTGKIFRVKGPLNVSLSPQERPVIVQAGSSEQGKNLAARTANVIFTAQPNLEAAQAFYKDVKSRLATYQRGQDELKVLPGLYFILGKTQEDALNKQKQLDDLIHEEVGLGLLGRMLGNFDLKNVDVHQPLPALDLTETGQKSRQQLLQKLSKDQHLTVKQLYEKVANGRGHFSVVGTAQQVADAIEKWVSQGAADGFNLMPALLTDIQDFVEQVVPILQEKGIFRTEYAGKTLRHQLNLQG